MQLFYTIEIEKMSKIHEIQPFWGSLLKFVLPNVAQEENGQNLRFLWHKNYKFAQKFNLSSYNFLEYVHRHYKQKKSHNAPS